MVRMSCSETELRSLTFEIIYGHALKPLPRARMGPESAVPLADLRAMLQADKRGRS